MRRAGLKLLLVAVAVWGAGCSCGGEPPVESKLAVGFEKPTDGQRLALDADADPAVDGFQFEVAAQASDTSGRAVTLSRATLEVRAASEQSWTPGPEGVIDGARVRFPATLLQPRTNVLRVTVEESGSKRTATQTITVSVATEVPSVDLSSPAEGQVLREADDADPAAPGYQVRFNVKTAALTGRQGTLYCEGVCGLPPTDFTVSSNGTTVVPVTLGDSSCASQAAACYAVVHGASGDVVSGKRTLTLDTVGPRVEVAAPVAPVASTTFKVEATVDCAESGVTATLSRPGTPDLTAPVMAGGVTFPAVTVPEDGDFPFTLRLTDSGGNTTTRTLPVTVASLAPTVQLDVASTVTTDADGVAANGVQAPVRVQVDSLPAGTTVALVTSVSGQFARPQRVVTEEVGGHRVAAFTVNLAEGANSVQACVRNAAGVERCALQPVTVSTGRAACRIVSPLDGALHASTTTSLPVRVEAGAGSVTVVALDAASGVERTRASASVSGGSALVPLTLAADGEYRLVASCPGGGVSQSLAVGVDTTPPALEVAVRGVPAGESTLGPDVADTSLQPGRQIALTVKTDAYATVAASGCVQGASESGQADASGALMLRAVSVPDSGTCELQVKSTDLAGLTTTHALPLTLAFQGSELVFLSPEAERYLGPGDGIVEPGVGLKVDVRLGLAHSAAGTLRLVRGATEVQSQAVAAGETEKTFTDVTLTEGATVLRAELVDADGRVLACATVLLLVDVTPGAITLRQPAPPPAPAPVYHVRDDLNVDLPGLQRPLQYEAPGASARATVDLCSDVAVAGTTPCRDGSGWYTLASRLPPLTQDFTYPQGRYAVKAVLDDGSVSVSDPVSLTVDSVEPRVRSATVLGDGNGDGVLNAAELASRPSKAPEVELSVEGVDDGLPVVVRSASNASVVYGRGTVQGGAATVVLGALPLGSEGRYDMVAVVTDTVGNTNRVSGATPLYPLNTAAFLTVSVDAVAPRLFVSAPERAVLGPTDDATSDAGFQLRATVSTDPDVGTGGVRIALASSGGPLDSVDLTPQSLVATHDFTVSASGEEAYTLTFTATDDAGNVTTDTRTVAVDLQAPSLDLQTPAQDSTFNSLEVAVRVAVLGGDGLKVRVFTQVGAGTEQLVGELTVASGVAQGTLVFPRGTQTVTAEVRDAAGNVARDSATNVVVEVRGCDLTLTDPAQASATLLVKDDRQPGTPGLQYRLKGNTPECRGRTVSLYRGASTTAEATTVADASTGDFLFDVTLADGEQTRLTVDVLNAADERSLDAVDVTVDLTAPVVTSVSPNPTTLYFVAATNAFLYPTPAPDHVPDEVAGGDATAVFTLNVTQAAQGKARFFYQGTAVSPEFAITSDSQQFPLRVTLPHNTTGTLELVVTDASGNEVRRTTTATVDVVPPAPITVTRTLTDARAAKVDVQWTASGDDGASGMPAGYDLRWTTNAQLDNGIPDVKTFFDTVVVKQEGGALRPATETKHTLTLPPLARYSIEVTPRDEVGNFADFTPQPVASQLRNFWRQVVLSNPGANGNGFAAYVAGRGDLNGDGFQDLVVGAATAAPGSVHVYYGVADPGTQTPVRQALTVPETGAQAFGADFDLGDVGNVTVGTTDAVDDLVVGVRGWTNDTAVPNRGRAFLYFGRKGNQLDPAAAVELRGEPNVQGNFAGTVKLIDDISGDGLRELAIAAHNESPPKVYIFFGRLQSDWLALREDDVTHLACTGSTTACVVPAKKADITIAGDAGTAFFGRARGYARLGDVDNDGVADFTVPASADAVNTVWAFSGATARTKKNLTTADRLAMLTGVTDTAPAGGTSGFGAEAVGGVDFAGGPGLDLVVAQPHMSRLFIYRDGASGFGQPPLVLLGNNVFGNALGVADLNGDGRPDLAVGQNRTPSNTFFFFNRNVPGAEFNPVQGEGFDQSKLEPFGRQGISLTVLDFNGDGKPDVATGDTANPARVVVYY